MVCLCVYLCNSKMKIFAFNTIQMLPMHHQKGEEEHTDWKIARKHCIHYTHHWHMTVSEIWNQDYLQTHKHICIHSNKTTGIKRHKHSPKTPNRSQKQFFVESIDQEYKYVEMSRIIYNVCSCAYMRVCLYDDAAAKWFTKCKFQFKEINVNARAHTHTAQLHRWILMFDPLINAVLSKSIEMNIRTN